MRSLNHAASGRQHHLFRRRVLAAPLLALTLLPPARAQSAELEAAIRELHPYEVPEILALPVSAGLPAYLEWLSQSCAP